MRLNDDPLTEKPDIVLDQATDLQSWNITLEDGRELICLMFEQIDKRIIFPVKFSPTEEDEADIASIILLLSKLRNGDAAD